jgi:hypothetical protein
MGDQESLNTLKRVLVHLQNEIVRGRIDQPVWLRMFVV